MSHMWLMQATTDAVAVGICAIGVIERPVLLRGLFGIKGVLCCVLSMHDFSLQGTMPLELHVPAGSCFGGSPSSGPKAPVLHAMTPLQ